MVYETIPRRKYLELVGAGVAGLAGAGAATAHGTAANYRAHLSALDGLDTDAQGQATFQLNGHEDELRYRLDVANIDDVLMAHIHLSPSDIVVWLYPADGPPPSLVEGRVDGVLATGTVTDDDLTGSLGGMGLSDLVAELDAGNAFVRVHTSEHPAGEIQGDVH
ncbi:MAG: CHRD domain-containing protein [Halobacteriaceae archaeon]